MQSLLLCVCTNPDTPQLFIPWETQYRQSWCYRRGTVHCGRAGRGLFPALFTPFTFEILSYLLYVLWCRSRHKVLYLHTHTPFFSPVNGTISSLSLYSMASFSRYLRRLSLLNVPVAFLDVWSFWRMPAGRRTFWGDRRRCIRPVT